LADREPLEADRADRDPVQRHDLVAQLGQHPADLTLLAFGEDQLERGGLALMADDPHSLGANLAIGQPDAFGYLGERFAGRQTGHQHAIQFLHAVARMRQSIRQLAVVGEDQEAGAVLVEAADGVDPLGDFGKQVDDPRTAGRVEGGRDITLGFIDGVIDHRLLLDRLAVDCDPSTRGIDPRAEDADDLAVDGDSTLEDQLLTGAAGAEPGVGQDFLKSLGCARFGIGLRGWLRRFRPGLVP
jgi:hypothetical protein